MGAEGSWVPIKFNGMLFTAQLPPETNVSGPSYRGWGADNWWQNTRLAYWSMFAPGDFSGLRVVFEYYLEMVPLLQARTRAYFGHSGLFVTETKTLFGLYSTCDYGPNATQRNTSLPPSDPRALPHAYEHNPYIRFDFGGDAGLPEVALMVLDDLLYTGDEEAYTRYAPLVEGTLDFYARHYNRSAGGELRIFPTQALETYWCGWPANASSCPTNDAPTVAALHALTSRALDLPPGLSTATRRAQWAELRAALPPVPLVREGGKSVVSPYATYPQQGIGTHNSETPELYSTHPFRHYTLGTHLSAGRDIEPSIYCLESSPRQTCRYADGNAGWNQGVLNAALLGRAARASRMVLDRAATAPAVGYRFPGFAPAEQDSDTDTDTDTDTLTLTLRPPSRTTSPPRITSRTWPPRCSSCCSRRLTTG